MTLYEQAVGFASTLLFVSGFICILILYYRASRRTRVGMLALSWLLVATLYWLIFFVLPEDWGMAWVAFMGLTFVFVFAFLGIIDFAIHADVRLKGGETARFVQGAALLALSAVLFVATYFVPDVLGALPLGPGFGGHFLGILGAALVAVLCFRAGARAAYANRAAVPRLLAARKATVEVASEKATYLPGETVRATVRLRAKKDFEVDDARAELWYMNRYSYMTPDPRGGSLLIDEVDRKIVSAEHLPMRKAMPSTRTAEYQVSLDLPTEIPPSGEGEVTGVAWAVGVIFDISGGPDVETEAPITVLSTRDVYETRAEGEQEASSSREVRMELLLDGRSFRAGDRIGGGLVVSARHAFEAREVRVELVRREIVLRDEGNHHEALEAEETVADRLRFRPGTARTVPFSIAVPREPICPCLETEYTYVGWHLRGTIAGARRTKYSVEQELNVYNGPQENGRA